MVKTVLMTFFISVLAFAQSLPIPKVEYVKYGKTVEVKDRNGNVLAILPENTEIQPIMLNRQGEPYEPYKGQRPYYNSNGRIAYGYIHNEQLGFIDIKNLTTVKPVEPKTVITPDTAKFILEGLQKIEQCAANELPANVLDMVRLFHETTCNNERTTKSIKEDLIKKWEQFIINVKAKDLAAGAIADEAMRVDMASRTVLYESHPEWMEESIGQCEWDIIALSLRNRAAACRPKKFKNHYGCKTKGDILGVATSSANYNIWRDQDANETNIGSCFLRPDLKDGEYINIPDDEKEFFRKRVNAYEKVVERTHEIFSLPEQELLDKFDVLSFKGNSTPTTNEKRRGVLGLKHYFHPQAMGQCYPDHNEDKRWKNVTYKHTRSIYAAYVEHRYVDDSGEKQTNYSLIRRRRIIPQIKSGNYWTFLAAEVFEDRDRTQQMTYEWNTNIYGDGVLPNWIVPESSKVTYACTYQGTPSQCAQAESYPNHMYRRMKYKWYDPQYGGKSIAIQCKIPETCTGSECPGFNGLCEPEIAIFTEMY